MSFVNEIAFKQKVGDFTNGLGFSGSSYLKLRNTTELNDMRVGTQKIEFLRTTENEAYGSENCGDWRISTNDECGFDFHRKQTDVSGLETYDGNVLEMKVNGDVNVVKPQGLRVNNTRVALTTEVPSTTASQQHKCRSSGGWRCFRIRERRKQNFW